MSELQGSVNLQGVGNFYRVMFFISFIFLVLVPLVILAADLWLESEELRFDGSLASLDGELTSLSEAMFADANSVLALEAEVMDIARSEQIFAADAEPRSIWRPDSRWSEMGKAHILELWNRQNALRTQATLSRTFLREKTAERDKLQATRAQVLFAREQIRERLPLLKATLLSGAGATVLFALLWGGLVQTRVNRLLARSANR